MVFAIMALVFIVVGGLSVMKWQIHSRWRDTWMGGKWYMGD